MELGIGIQGLYVDLVVTDRGARSLRASDIARVFDEMRAGLYQRGCEGSIEFESTRDVMTRRTRYRIIGYRYITDGPARRPE